MEIQDFRIYKERQVKVNNRWYNLVTFTDECFWGKYGIKVKVSSKAFNPYMFFDKKESEKITNYFKI